MSEKHRLARLGKRHSSEVKAKMSASQRAKWKDAMWADWRRREITRTNQTRWALPQGVKREDYNLLLSHNFTRDEAIRILTGER